MGAEHIIYCMSCLNAKKAGAQVEFQPVGHIYIGEKDGTVSERVQAIHDLLNGWVPCRISQEIVLDIWRKYMFNAACNTVQSILRGPHLWFQQLPDACAALECVMQEIVRLAHGMVYRQPFPGPGLGVRCLGAITRDRLHALREADAILREEFDKNGLAGKVWQYFIAVPDMKSVGVKDGKRYEGWPAIIRAVNTTDAMSATIEEIPYPLLHHITARITAEVEGINRVLLDLTPKPVGTIEWE